MLEKNAADSGGFVDDMTSLNAINEPSILHVLEGRAKIQDVDETREKCFTYMVRVDTMTPFPTYPPIRPADTLAR